MHYQIEMSFNIIFFIYKKLRHGKSHSSQKWSEDLRILSCYITLQRDGDWGPFQGLCVTVHLKLGFADDGRCSRALSVMVGRSLSIKTGLVNSTVLWIQHTVDVKVNWGGASLENLTNK